VRTLISTDHKLAVLQSLVKTRLLNPFFSPAVDDGLEKALKERLENWKRTFEKNGQPERFVVLEYIADQLVFL